MFNDRGREGFKYRSHEFRVVTDPSHTPRVMAPEELRSCLTNPKDHGRVREPVWMSSDDDDDRTNLRVSPTYGYTSVRYYDPEASLYLPVLKTYRLRYAFNRLKLAKMACRHAGTMIRGRRKCKKEVRTHVVGTMMKPLLCCAHKCCSPKQRLWLGNGPTRCFGLVGLLRNNCGFHHEW